MSVRLTVTQRSEAGGAPATEIVLDDSEITLGRDKSCQVVLAQQAVSRNHARILQEGNLHFLEDLGSSYGTQVNGKALPKGEKRLLRNGDVIAIAQFDVRFERVVVEAPSEDDAGQSQKTSFIARNLVKDAMRGLAGGGEERFLRIMNGPREGERIGVSEAQELIIGRDEGVDIIIKADLVSRRHAKVRRDWSGTHVEDLGSRNGIRVNKKKVTRKQLKDGDEVEVGGIRLLYVDPSEAPEPPADSNASGGEPVPAEAASSSRRLVAARERSIAKQRAPVEEPKVEEPPPPEEPPPGESTNQAPSEEPPTEQPPPAYVPPEPEPEPEQNGLSRLGDKQKLVPLVVMGVFGLVAVGLIIALLAGA